jgi:tight adherence protein B
MIAAELASAGLMAAIVLTGNGSGSRLRSSASPVAHSERVLHRWPARPGRSTSLMPGLEVPASLALELRSGRELSAALTAVAHELFDHPDLTDRLQAAARSAATAAPVTPALVGPSDRLGRDLRVTAICCDVASSAGLPLADILDAVAGEARDRLLLVGRAKAELAGARSTSRVLGCLPLVGLAMGQLLGARPLHVLLSTGWGLCCLLAALVLTAAGAAWSRAITSAAARSLP